MEQKEILEKLDSGELSPEEAIKAYEKETVHISEVACGDMRVKVLDCGFPTLNDSLVFKEERGELIVFGARPSHGKSAFMFQVAAYVAKSKNVLIYSLEMDKKSIKDRMIAAELEQNLTGIQKGLVPRPRIQEAERRLNGLKLFFDDAKGGRDVRGIRSSAISFHNHTPLSLVVVDYMQIVKTTRRNNRNDEIGEVSSELKALAMDLKCPILVGSQLNRSCEYRGKESGNYKPVLADIRESGNIEQDADLVLFLNRDYVYTKAVKDIYDADLEIAKSRNGPTGAWKFRYTPGCCTFKDSQEAL